jgi:site-specific recombinase XerD
MLEKIFSSDWIIKEHQTGPLARYSEELAAKLIAEGHARYDLRHRFGVISDLNRWLQRRGIPLAKLTEAMIAKFIKYREANSNFYKNGSSTALRKLLQILREHKAIPAATIVNKWGKEIESIAEAFATYLRLEKGFSAVASKRYQDCTCRFLFEVYGTSHVVLTTLAPDDITQFIIRCHKRFSPKNTQTIASIIRAFLRFLYVNGDQPQDFSGCIPSIPCWRAQHLPEFLEQKDVILLLKSCDRRTKKGMRNYALLLLFVRLGLRASEALQLSLDDIDWKHGIVLIRGKGPKEAKLPLPSDVGEALVAYIKRVRPLCKSRRIFLRSRAPYRELNNASSVSTIVRRALLTAHLAPKHKGAHLLRYTAATECLRQGATLFEVGELLRHRSIDTTAIYAKVDINRLGELAPSWPAF